MNLVNCLDRVQMVNTRVQPDLIHDHDACFLGVLFKLPHGGRDVASGDDVSLAFDGGLDHSCMVGVWDEGNY